MLLNPTYLIKLLRGLVKQHMKIFGKRIIKWPTKAIIIITTFTIII